MIFSVCAFLFFRCSVCGVSACVHFLMMCAFIIEARLSYLLLNSSLLYLLPATCLPAGHYTAAAISSLRQAG